MKIGIYTQPLRNNYGGILQNYALQQVLIKLGHSPLTIDFRPNASFVRYILSQCKTLLLFFIPSKRRPFRKFMRQQPRFPQMADFVSRNILTTTRLDWIGNNIVKRYGFEAVISGSDQVWRPIYNFKLQYSFLSFVKANHINKIAYAASFGVDCWEYSDSQTKMCSKLAKDFDAISVREYSAIALCKNYLNVDAIDVLDPTLLLEKEQYMSLCNEIPKPSSSFLAAYVLDMTDNARQLIKRIANEKKLEVRLFSADANLALTVEYWLSSFRDANYVITDSFHGTVFSIIFRKPFISIVNKKRGSDRFVSLLSKFNLMSRISDTKESAFDDLAINWTNVDTIMEYERKKSLRFLTDSLMRK